MRKSGIFHTTKLLFTAERPHEMSDTLLYNVLGQSSFVILNKALNRALGANESMILSFLVDRRNFTNGADFFYTIDNLCYDTALGEKAIRSAMKNLIDKGILIKKDFVGLPPKQYYNINMRAILGILSNPSPKGRDIPASIDNPSQMESINPLQKATLNPSPKGRDIYNNKDNNNKNNNIEFEKKVSNETYFSHSLVRNEISHDCVGKQSQDITPHLEATSQAQTTSQDELAKETKRGRQGSDSLFEAMPNPKRKQYQAEFEEFWKMYPKKEEKGKAYALYLQKVPKIISHEELCNRLSQQRKVWEAKRTQMQYIPQCQKWLRNDTFKDNFDEILESYRQDSYHAPNQQVSSEASRMAEIDKKIEAGRFTRDMEQEHIELYGRGAIDFDEYMRIFEENERRKKEQRLN